METCPYGKKFGPPHNECAVGLILAFQDLDSFGTPKSSFFRRYLSWFRENQRFFENFENVVIFHHLARSWPPKITFFILEKHTIPITRKILIHRISSFWKVIDSTAYPNFTFWKFCIFKLAKKILHRFVPRSFWTELLVFESFFTIFGRNVDNVVRKRPSNEPLAVQFPFSIFFFTKI